jgi:hypothetical protein
MKIWVWSLLSVFLGILGIVTSLAYDGTILMGIACALTLNNIVMTVFWYVGGME